jgi:hypothetical protein
MDGWMTNAKSRVFLLGSGSLANPGWLALLLSLLPTYIHRTYFFRIGYQGETRS